MNEAPSDGSGPDKGFDIVPLSEVDQETVLALLLTSLSSSGVTAKTESFWRWKHEESAFGPSIGCAAKARTGGALVAVRPLMRWVFVAPGHVEVPALRPVDTVTDPSWRGRGLFSRLTRFAISQIDGRSTTLIFNTPNANSLPGYEKMGWIRSDSLKILVRPGGILRILRSLLAGTFRRPANDGWHGMGRSDVLLPGEMSAQLIDEIVDFCASSEAARIPVGLRTQRTRAFLIWRYFSQPNAEYGFSLVRNSSGEIASVVILRPEVRRWATAVLMVDVFTRHVSVGSVREALEAAMRRVRADFFVSHAANGSIEAAAMRHEMFLPIKSKILAARVVGADVDSPALNASAADLAWDLSLADIEIF